MFQVAIDGPAGAGKSTIAKLVAKEFGFIYVDTGAMYRAMALAVLRAGVDIEDEGAVTELCKGLAVSLAYEDHKQQVLLNGENVNDYIRTEEVSKATSTIAVYQGVREKLLELQRQLGREHNVVMDGRDIGTNVLKDADVKIYLTASTRTRARRRYDELVAKGTDCKLEDIEKEIEERDNRDMNRKIAPLKQAEDAVLVDSSDLNIEEVTAKLKDIIQKKL